MPAAAVIPAPEAYVNVAAVKTLVVGCSGGSGAVLDGSSMRRALVITVGPFVKSGGPILP